MANTHTGTAPDYFVPAPSNWPMVGMIAMIFTTFGAAMVVNRVPYGGYVLVLGFAVLVYMLFGWFLFSEVMFFGSFFGALYYARVITLPALGDFDHKVLWPDFTAAWPTTGPGGTIEQFTKIHAWPLPTVNTILLVTSGIWLTIAHHALRDNNRGKTAFWLFLTLLFGFSFVGIQAYEYGHAYTELNLKLSSGIF